MNKLGLENQEGFTQDMLVKKNKKETVKEAEIKREKAKDAQNLDLMLKMHKRESVQMTRDIEQLVLDLNKKKSSVNNNDQLENFVNDHITVHAKTPKPEKPQSITVM